VTGQQMVDPNTSRKVGQSDKLRHSDGSRSRPSHSTGVKEIARPRNRPRILTPFLARVQAVLKEKVRAFEHMTRR